MHTTNNVAIFCALLRRDLSVMKKSLVGDLIDAAIFMFISVVTFGKLLPIIGLKPSLIAPLYIGSNLIFAISTRGYALAMGMIYKITYEGLGLIGYHLTLPIDKRWLFAEYIIYFVIQTCVITLPVLLLGTSILSTMINLTIYSFPLFLGMYLLTLTFWGTLFIGSAFVYEFKWFQANLWTRRIDFFIVMGSTFYPWDAVHNFSPLVSYVMLLNPITYAMEGMRSALFNTPTSFPLWLCALVLIASIGITSMWLRAGIRKTLDPV